MIITLTEINNEKLDDLAYFHCADGTSALKISAEDRDYIFLLSEPDVASLAEGEIPEVIGTTKSYITLESKCDAIAVPSTYVNLIDDLISLCYQDPDNLVISYLKHSDLYSGEIYNAARNLTDYVTSENRDLEEENKLRDILKLNIALHALYEGVNTSEWSGLQEHRDYVHGTLWRLKGKPMEVKVDWSKWD